MSKKQKYILAIIGQKAAAYECSGARLLIGRSCDEWLWFLQLFIKIRISHRYHPDSVFFSSQEVPNFSTQTGQACPADHVAFGPQLTPYSRDFNLQAYVQNDGADHGLPIDLMLDSLFAATQKSQNPSPVSHFW